MITAYVLIQTDVGQAGLVATAPADIDGVQQAQPLAGPYDVIVRAEPVTLMLWADWSCHGSRPSMVSPAP
jgi:hypothetical protein